MNILFPVNDTRDLAQKKGLYSSDVLITLSEINEICFNKISTGCLRKIRKIPKNFKLNI